MKKRTAFICAVSGIAVIVCYAMMALLDGFFYSNRAFGEGPLLWEAFFSFVKKFSLPHPIMSTFVIWTLPFLIGYILFRIGMKKLDSTDK
jgi:hypothetical protein